MHERRWRIPEEEDEEAVFICESITNEDPSNTQQGGGGRLVVWEVVVKGIHTRACKEVGKVSAARHVAGLLFVVGEDDYVYPLWGCGVPTY